MKQLNQFSVLLLFLIVFSCGDRKSAETLADKEKIEADQESTKLPGQQDMVATSKAHNDSILRIREQAKADSALASIEAKDASNFFAPVPPELKDRVVYHELPTTATVGIRPYPNAYVIKMNPKTKYKGKTYVTIELASPDAPEKVLEYYQKWKDNWFYMGGEGIYTFKQDENKYFRETNTLQILTFNNDLHVEISSLLTFQPETLIRIYYEAK